MIRTVIGATLIVALFSFTAQAAMHWSPAPMKHGHGGHDRHAGKPFVLTEGAGAAVTLLTPKLVAKPMSVEQARVVVTSTGMDNYHALVATRSSGDLHESAIRYVYMFGKPSGESPSDIMAYEKSALEIEPSPYAREHWRYLSDTEVVFKVRYKGQSLPLAIVTMTTSNGGSAEFKADEQGVVRFTLPEDFSDIKPGRMANRPGEFILSARYEEGGGTHLTSFSSAYHVNPNHWQSTGLGVAVVAAGMLIGGLVFVCKRRKEKS